MDTTVEPNLWYPCLSIRAEGGKTRYLRLTDVGFEETADAIDWFISEGILTRANAWEDEAFIGGWGIKYFICVGMKTHGRAYNHQTSQGAESNGSR